MQAGGPVSNSEGVLAAQHDRWLLPSTSANSRSAPDAYAGRTGFLVSCIHLWKILARLLQCRLG